MKTLITADELERTPDDDSVQIELDEGEVIIMPLAGLVHGDCEVEIACSMQHHVKQHKLGRVYVGDTGFRLGNDIVRAPDVAFVRAQRVEAIRSTGFAKGFPDLAVEIYSPGDSVRQLMRKVKQYFAAGTHTVWIAYPEERAVQVLKADGTDILLKGEDLIESPELLPGFSVAISEFFTD